MTDGQGFFNRSVENHGVRPHVRRDDGSQDGEAPPTSRYTRLQETMGRRRQAGFRVAEVAGRALCRWMLLARLPTLRPPVEKQYNILEAQNRIQSATRPTCQPETAEGRLECSACLGMPDKRGAHSVTHHACSESS
jgi:hypothetical protein